MDNRLRLYVNGILKDTSVAFVRDTSRDDPLNIGRSPYPGWEGYFNGLIDEVHVYDRALTAEEVQSNMVSGTPVANGLVASWHFDEGAGQVAYDSTANGNDGQLGSTAGEDSNDPMWTTDHAPITSTWQYTQTVAIYNPGTTALTDYQVRFDVAYRARMNGDFSDVRFKADPAGDFLPYWIESYTESDSAVMWVKVPSLPAGATTNLTMVYGNLVAEDASDGDAVFEFFDDFEDGDYTQNPAWTDAVYTGSDSNTIVPSPDSNYRVRSTHSGGIAYNYDFPRGLFSEAIAGEAGIAIPTVGWTFAEITGRVPWLGQVSWLEWDWVDRYPMQHGYGRQDIRMVDDRPVDCGC